MSCQIKNRFSFALSPLPEATIWAMPLPTEIRLACDAMEVRVKKGSAVLHGEILATSAFCGKAALVSPVAGKVQSVDCDFIVIKVGTPKAAEKEDAKEELEKLKDKSGEASEEVATELPQFESVEAAYVQNFSKEELLEQLPLLGFDVCSFASAKTVIINALEAEPNISAHAALLREESEVLLAGLGILQKMAAVIFAFPEGYGGELCRFEHFFHQPSYPFCMDAFVQHSAKVKAENSTVLSLSALYRLGKIALTGLACNHTVMSVFGRNYRVLHGTPVLHILQAAGCELYPEDQLVLGGAFRGRCLFNPGQGTQVDDLAVTVVHQKDFPKTRAVDCLNCGECVLACPVGLMPNLLSRYAQYNLFEQDLKHGIHFCVECGLCSYACIAQRPVLQYIQMAKAELKKAAALPKFSD